MWDKTKIRAYVALQVTQKDPRALHRFGKAVLLDRVRGPYDKHGSQCFWHVSGKKALRVISMLWPFLSDPKKEQIARVKEVAEKNECAKHTS